MGEFKLVFIFELKAQVSTKLKVQMCLFVTFSGLVLNSPTTLMNVIL